MCRLPQGHRSCIIMSFSKRQACCCLFSFVVLFVAFFLLKINIGWYEICAFQKNRITLSSNIFNKGGVLEIEFKGKKSLMKLRLSQKFSFLCKEKFYYYTWTLMTETFPQREWFVNRKSKNSRLMGQKCIDDEANSNYLCLFLQQRD